MEVTPMEVTPMEVTPMEEMADFGKANSSGATEKVVPVQNHEDMCVMTTPCVTSMGFAAEAPIDPQTTNIATQNIQGAYTLQPTSDKHNTADGLIVEDTHPCTRAWARLHQLHSFQLNYEHTEVPTAPPCVTDMEAPIDPQAIHIAAPQQTTETASIPDNPNIADHAPATSNGVIVLLPSLATDGSVQYEPRVLQVATTDPLNIPSFDDMFGTMQGQASVSLQHGESAPPTMNQQDVEVNFQSAFDLINANVDDTTVAEVLAQENEPTTPF